MKAVTLPFMKTVEKIQPGTGNKNTEENNFEHSHSNF